MPETVKCGRCGFENPAGMKFCGNCGAKLMVPEASRCTSSLESLVILHTTGSLYLAVSLVFNSLVRASFTLTILYLTPTILGLYTAYALSRGKTRRYLKITSLATVILGLTSTLILFIIGLGIRGVIGPAWIIFLVNAWLLWKKRSEI